MTFPEEDELENLREIMFRMEQEAEWKESEERKVKINLIVPEHVQHNNTSIHRTYKKRMVS